MVSRRKNGLSYRQSGVDIDANTVWVSRIQSALRSTNGPRVISKAGAFAGMFRLDDSNRFKRNYSKPVLVGCADGVGTKVLLGIKTGRLFGLGIDLVAMNVNDLITCGAEPLFFLDYLAVHKLSPDALVQVIEGIAEGCRQAGCALLGGETAEMPDLYRRGDIDLAGFAVGVVQYGRTIDGSGVKPGDVLIGLPSSGVHSNGYSLVRKLITARRLKLAREYDELGESLADALLRPTKIYVKDVLGVIESDAMRRSVVGMAHITGGGLPENVARALSDKCDAEIELQSWRPPPIFPFIERLGVEREEMFRVFNMGIGFVLVVRTRACKKVMRLLEESGAIPIVIGRVTRGTGKVLLR